MGTQNTFKMMDKKLIAMLHKSFLLNWPYGCIFSKRFNNIILEGHVFQYNSSFNMAFLQMHGLIQRGGGGGGGDRGSGPPSPRKSQVIWVSIGNKQLDNPWKKLDPLWNLGKVKLSLKYTVELK